MVLVIDDDPDILRLLAMLLGSEGCATREAATPQAALSMLSGVDVAIVDQRMPAMTGTQFIAAARAAGSRCRFLVISAESRSAADAAAVGVSFLPKPLDVRAMMDEVERLFALGPEGPR